MPLPNLLHLISVKHIDFLEFFACSGMSLKDVVFYLISTQALDFINFP